jgi:hypothetical protein
VALVQRMTIVGMGIVMLQQNRVALVPVIVVHVQTRVETGIVIVQEKHVVPVQLIVEHVHQLARRLINTGLWKGGTVY